VLSAIRLWSAITRSRLSTKFWIVPSYPVMYPRAHSVESTCKYRALVVSFYLLRDGNLDSKRKRKYLQYPSRSQVIPNIFCCALETEMAGIGRVILGYFKISGYTAPSPSTFAEICQTTFETSYSTVLENRQKGITCRTWVLQVLSFSF